MKNMLLVLGSLIALFGLTACEEPEPTTYPLSGEVCSPDDPVQGLDAHDCIPPV